MGGSIMSQAILQGGATGTGNYTVLAPSTNNNQTLTLPDGTGTLLSTSNPQSGGVIQVVSTTKTDTFTMSGQTQTAITGLTATIIPKFSTSKILVMVTIGGFAQGSGQGRFILTRGGSTISGAIGDASGSAPRTSDSFTVYNGGSGATQINAGITYLDSPATTSSTAYGVTVSSNDAGQAIYINRSATDTDSASYQRNITTITVMEIAA
jgi:hypothetical protein